MVRFGNSGIREVQSGTRHVTIFMSMIRVLTVVNMRETDGGVCEWKVDRLFPAMDNDLSDGNCRSIDPSLFRLVSIRSVYDDSQRRASSAKKLATNLFRTQ